MFEKPSIEQSTRRYNYTRSCLRRPFLKIHGVWRYIDLFDQLTVELYTNHAFYFDYSLKALFELMNNIISNDTTRKPGNVRCYSQGVNRITLIMPGNELRMLIKIWILINVDFFIEDISQGRTCIVLYCIKNYIL